MKRAGTVVCERDCLRRAGGIHSSEVSGGHEGQRGGGKQDSRASGAGREFREEDAACVTGGIRTGSWRENGSLPGDEDVVGGIDGQTESEAIAADWRGKQIGCAIGANFGEEQRSPSRLV